MSGRGPIGSALTATLVATYDPDVPDVVLSRTPLQQSSNGSFNAVISIAPGFGRGCIITVYVTSNDGSAAAKAQYLVDAPNRGAVIPFVNVPASVR